jgi:hypothetical protein
MNVETKQWPRQWMHTYSSNELKKFKRCLPARKLMATVFRVIMYVFFVYSNLFSHFPFHNYVEVIVCSYRQAHQAAV